MSSSQQQQYCLSMHQPWASLLVYGIKRIEGRAWQTEFRGKLWIQAAQKFPEDSVITEVEQSYQQIYEIEGKPPPTFPKEYPTGVIVGSVEVVDCLRAEQIEAWEGLLESIKLEVSSPFGFLCEQPRIVKNPIKLRGQQKIFRLDNQRLIQQAEADEIVPPGYKKFSWYDFSKPPDGSDKYSPHPRRLDWQQRYGQ
eukprot:TRINITY_DN10217_c0_g1_i3.p3 TRINITY_DN10217_c0_g1~~TRINITY_DN10217_c0_g1_i3.p3  ORF type:complete len:196 (-),score=32.96 TRINITY_DN10217_c0_g1_i3:280-867(-)